jgi:hypothetical protein
MTALRVKLNETYAAASASVQMTAFIQVSPPISATWRVKAVHIVGLVLALIGGAAFWYWRFKLLREAGSEVADMVGRVRGAHRMRKFKKRAEASPLASIADPAMAAAVFLHALANENDESLPQAEPEIRRQIGAIVPAAELDEVISYARWAARDVADPRDLVRRFKPLWREKLTSEERAHLVAMAETILGLSGDEPEHNQRLSFATLRTALSPEQMR